MEVQRKRELGGQGNIEVEGKMELKGRWEQKVKEYGFICEDRVVWENASTYKGDNNGTVQTKVKHAHGCKHEQKEVELRLKGAGGPKWCKNCYYPHYQPFFCPKLQTLMH